MASWSNAAAHALPLAEASAAAEAEAQPRAQARACNQRRQARRCRRSRLDRDRRGPARRGRRAQRRGAPPERQAEQGQRRAGPPRGRQAGDHLARSSSPRRRRGSRPSRTVTASCPRAPTLTTYVRLRPRHTGDEGRGAAGREPPHPAAARRASSFLFGIAFPAGGVAAGGPRRARRQPRGEPAQRGCDDPAARGRFTTAAACSSRSASSR